MNDKIKQLLNRAQSLQSEVIRLQPVMSDDEIRSIIKDVCIKNECEQHAAKIKIEWSPNLTRCMGKAYLDSSTIQFSIPLFQRATAFQRKENIAHETCHILAYLVLHRNDQHGYYWGNMMIRAGYQPKRCHEVDNRDLRKVQYNKRVACACGGTKVSNLIFNRMKQGHTYLCKLCKCPITFAVEYPEG